MLQRPSRLRTFYLSPIDCRRFLHNYRRTPRKRSIQYAAALRNALSDEQRNAAAQAIADRTFSTELNAGVIVSGYWPIRNEIDPTPLMRALAAQGAELALPAIVARDQPLRFRAWRLGGELIPGQFGIFEPPPDAPEVIPDIMLIPMAAFDRAGHRIGYGAGYYDRTLAQLAERKKVTAIGLAFAVQEVGTIPALSHDVKLNYVLTELRAFDFRSL